MDKEIILLAMVKLNHHYQKLIDKPFGNQAEKRVAQCIKEHPSAVLLHLTASDMPLPPPASILSALLDASQGLAASPPPIEDLLSLRKAIASSYANIHADEIFISPSARSTLAELQEIFSIENRIAIPDPCDPAILDVHVMAGRTRPLLKTGLYGGVTYLSCTEQNNLQPQLPNCPVDLIYLSSPHNPTGVALDKALLTQWVQYAKKHQAIILYDSSYQAFISSDAPRSIYEIEGAHEVAIEVRSLAKMGAFAPLRCAYAVIPQSLKVQDAGARRSVHALWTRRLETRDPSVTYPIQKAAAALFTSQGKKQAAQLIHTSQTQALTLLTGLRALGYTVYGGVDSPYIWCKTPSKITSWNFFEFLLEHVHIVTTPGIAFGKGGDGYIRFSAFTKPEVISESLSRLKKLA